MSIPELMTAFSVKGELLGDRVQRRLGCDIDVLRYEKKPDSRAYPFLGRVTCAYAYSTRASVAGATLGRADIYRNCKPAIWFALTEGRMKNTLVRLGYDVVRFGCFKSSALLWRVITSPAVEPLIVIREVLFLSAIDAALDRQGQQGMPRICPATIITASEA